MSGIDKNSRMLGLYHQLIAGKHIDKQSYCAENEITERSFDRDIEDVRLFLCEEHSYCELIYDRNSKSYYLTHTIGKSLPGELTLYLADVIFLQKNLSEDEMNGMLLSLLDVTDIYMAIGAVALSWIPIVEPIVGGIVGGTIGYMAGSKFGRAVYSGL